jgi:hypothetical protein
MKYTHGNMVQLDNSRLLAVQQRCICAAACSTGQKWQQSCAGQNKPVNLIQGAASNTAI